MRVKLLKKIRKRFVFYYDREEVWGNPWKIYDKAKKKQCHFFHIGIPYYADQATYEMMSRLGLLEYWSRLYDRKDARRIARHRAEVSEKFMSRELKP